MRETEHWQEVYSSSSEDDFSWHQPSPQGAVNTIQHYAPALDARIIDIGAGTSRLVDLLLDRGYRNLTVLDISAEALTQTRQRLGPRAVAVTFLTTDILASGELGEFDLWHDRALFHFLTTEQDRTKYVMSATRSVVPGGHVVLAAFALDGPDKCSSLPVCRYDADSIESAFGESFRLVESDRVVHETPWGSTQPFTIAVLLRH